MAALLISQETKKKIQEVIVYAANNLITSGQLLLIKEGIDPPPGQNPNFCCQIEKGFEVVYTHVEEEVGLCKHISISLNGILPPVWATAFIMVEFGMQNLGENHYIWINDRSEVRSINILELIQ